MLRLAFLLVAASLAAKQHPPSLDIRPLADDPTRIEVVAQVDEGRLALALLGKDDREGPPILGKVRQRAERTVFTPKYALGRGLRYRATLQRLDGSKVTATYRVPVLPKSEPAVVKQVYPSASILPANNLKFYLHFSKPMREGKAIFDHIKILDFENDGEPIRHPWRRVELWSHNATRLTLWIHPGRIKQGVNLREDEGPVLRADRRYALVVSREVRDAMDQPLGQAHTKEFLATPVDHKRPLPLQWKIIPPKSGTLNPLRLKFPEPLDHSLLQRMLIPRQLAGQKVEGTIQVEETEKIWCFTPTRPWQTTKYIITVDPELEDLAGNTPGRLFDTDVRAKKTNPPSLKLPFIPGED